MGRYIDDILQPGEKVLYSTNAHWMFFLPAIAAWIVAIVFLVLSRMVAADALMLVCLAFAAVAALVALYRTATAWFHRWTTETDVTNMRVVHKTGFIKRRTFEMSLDKVESVDVNQSILGRLINYGDVTIQGVGEGTQDHLHHCFAAVVSQCHHGTTGRHVNHGHAAEFIRRSFHAAARSTRPKSQNSQSCRTSGGTPGARWPRCTRSIRCGSPISATPPAASSIATPKA